MKSYTKPEATKAAKKFIKKVRALEKEYGFNFYSNHDDIGLSYRHSSDIDEDGYFLGSINKASKQKEFEENAKQEAESKYPEYPDDCEVVHHDWNYEDKQDYFRQGAEWAYGVINQWNKLQ